MRILEIHLCDGCPHKMHCTGIAGLKCAITGMSVYPDRLPEHCPLPTLQEYEHQHFNKMREE